MKGKQLPNVSLSLDMDHEKTSVMGYRTLFEVSGINHSYSRNQITHDVFKNGYFILLLVLKPDRCDCEGNTSHPENGNISMELKFNKPLPEANTCLLYLEFDNSILINLVHSVTTEV